MGDATLFREFRLCALREHADAFTSDAAEAEAKPLSDAGKRLAHDSSEKIWGVFVEGKLAGIAGLNRETRLKNRHKATLVAMYVAPGFKGRGVGKALMKTIVEDASESGIELIVLTVTAGNQPATRLYKQAGFLPFGTEPDAIRVNGTSYDKTHMYLQLKRTLPAS